jgi:hypothetical protein
MTFEPDTKDWTWVLQRPCPECGLDTQSFPRDRISAMIRANPAAWHDLLTGPDDPRLRPSPGKWSSLEYGCHVRDVLRLYEQRLTLMLAQDEPLFPNWDQDATAVEDRYGDTVESFSRYFIHDPVHHFYDATGTPYAAQQ